MADRIYVPEGGLIVEQESHTELMEQNGRYSTMFHVQADAYLESPGRHWIESIMNQNI